MADQIQPDVRLNTRGELCPMPVVKARLALDKLTDGQVLEVAATDKGSVPDFQSFALETGHELLAQRQENGVYYHYLRKAS